ncbi:MAG: hypothetical protein EU981_04065 [Candidatus Liberibacter ctenarytainae]|uniref:Uncharacterized protein n=1 Tax=Candidatus Liberibacter ctenarytainae TaxID=2020335 RepID=A0A937AKB6_9HYPH|nr:hypothetical protein [Candidatus Liberibacter ctenarytainae]
MRAKNDIIEEWNEQYTFNVITKKMSQAIGIEKINLMAESHKQYIRYQDAKKAGATAGTNLWDSVANLEYDPSWLRIKQRPFKETLPGSLLKRDHS